MLGQLVNEESDFGSPVEWLDGGFSCGKARRWSFPLGDEEQRSGELPGGGHGDFGAGLMVAANCWKRFLRFWISSWGPAGRGGWSLSAFELGSLGPGHERLRVGEMELVW